MPAPIQSFPFDIGACKGPGGEQGLSANEYHEERLQKSLQSLTISLGLLKLVIDDSLKGIGDLFTEFSKIQ